MKDKIYVLALLCLVLLANNGCKKKESKPYGQNIVSCKIDGIKYSINQDYTNWSGTGIRPNITGTQRSFAASFSRDVGIGVGVLPVVGTIGTFMSSKAIPNIYPTNGISVSLRTLNLNGAYKDVTYISDSGTCTTIFTVNSPSFVSGTFSGTLHQDTSWAPSSMYPNAPLSITIIDGYFDVPLK
jgi:hypothetical protein